MISGYLKEIYVNEGDHVKKGQLLFKIDNPQYDQEVLLQKPALIALLRMLILPKWKLIRSNLWLKTNCKQFQVTIF